MPDLVGPSCLQAQGYQAVAVSFVHSLVMGDGRLPMLEVHGPFNDGSGLAGKGSVDRAGLRKYMPAHDGKILPADSMPAHHIGEDTAADQVLRDNGKAGGVSVQTVAAAEDKGLALLLVVPGQGICPGIRVVIERRMDRHTGRLVDHDDILVLIYNVKRKLHGRNLPGAFRLADADTEPVSCRKLLSHIPESVNFV